ncbi:MAG: hypothetical protein FVQ85_02975 [Planctomycetes bacterium]|nr:hypothetical protein [Planctomycetota bacterium]
MLKGRPSKDGFPKDTERVAKIKDLRQTIKICECMIHSAQDLVNPEAVNNFASYLKLIDEAAEKIKQQRQDLIARYNAAQNGKIPALQQNIIKVQKKLAELKATEPVNKRITRAHDLREKIIQLEQELYDATLDATFNIEDLIKNAEPTESE